jgi:hypothetical protein
LCRSDRDWMRQNWSLLPNSGLSNRFVWMFWNRLLLIRLLLFKPLTESFVPRYYYHGFLFPINTESILISLYDQLLRTSSLNEFHPDPVIANSSLSSDRWSCILNPISQYCYRSPSFSSPFPPYYYEVRWNSWNIIANISFVSDPWPNCSKLDISVLLPFTEFFIPLPSILLWSSLEFLKHYC